MTQTASKGWREVAAKFWTARRETPTSEIEDMADFGAIVAKVTADGCGYSGMDELGAHIIRKPTEAELLAALKREIGGMR